MSQSNPTSGGGASAGPVSMLICAECGKKNKIRPAERGSPHCGTCGVPLPWLVNATDATFGYEARSSVAVLVDLWAPWCGPCRMVAPILENLSHEFADSLKVVKVNVDESPRTAQRYEARSIPMLLFMRDGELVDTVVGAQPEHVLRQRIGALG